MLNGVAPLPLVPFPAEAEVGPDVRFSATSRIVSADITAAEANLFASDIAKRTGITPTVTTDAPGPQDIVIVLGEDTTSEGYTLSTADGYVRITAATPAGAYFATRTALQLLTPTADGWNFRGARITDAPRFGFRGVMLDVARHFFTVAEVCRYIDLVSQLKINVLHLHLTDDQGWRIEIDGYPKLTELAAASASMGDTGGFYTQDDFRTIVAHAAMRHMTVIPEIDMPSHTHAVTVAYPEFCMPTVLAPSVVETATLFQQDLPEFGKPYPGWCVGFSALKSGDAATNAFVAEVFRQLAALTPGPWLHLGGDEALGTTAEDFAGFVRMAAQSIVDAGKTPVAWHEAGKASGLPTGTVGQYWGYVTPQPGYDDEARAFVTNGGSLILSPADVSYLDMKYTADAELGLAWANGPTTAPQSYDWDPSQIISGIGESDILGVEAPLWTETIRTFTDVETMVFPRLAGIADIAWSPQGAPSRTWESVRTRVAALAPAWQAEGVHYHPSEEIPWQA